MRLAPGSRFGPYEVVAQIGAGGMGEVWKARDTRLDRIVALKFSTTTFNQLCESEGRAISALNHPHICQLYDVGPNYLVMEYVDGKPLSGPLPLDKALLYAGQILDALHAAHSQGIVHRDLKPANILVSKTGVKLLDFGIAQHLPTALQQGVNTQTALNARIAGTLQYMSPEQIEDQPIDSRSDLFSFGCVLYELLSGRRPFVGPTATSVIGAILEREPAPLDVPPALARVVRGVASAECGALEHRAARAAPGPTRHHGGAGRRLRDAGLGPVLRVAARHAAVRNPIQCDPIHVRRWSDDGSRDFTRR